MKISFKHKALIQRFLSRIPMGQALNYLIQRHVSKSLPPSNSMFLKKVGLAYRHYQNFKEYQQTRTPLHRYYEFGAGRTLSIPLSMSFLGFDVHCIDIQPLANRKMVNSSLEKFDKNRAELPFSIPKSLSPLSDRLNENLTKKFRIQYQAPLDARNTGFDTNSFDFISSTFTFEHVPASNILLILEECFRILAPGGVFSMTIDYQDHWSYFDRNISIYNFLQYEDRAWKRYNPTLHYQNRWRHSDYMDLIKQTSFNVVKTTPKQGLEVELKALSNLPLAEPYSAYSIEDLAVKSSEIVLTKPI